MPADRRTRILLGALAAIVVVAMWNFSGGSTPAVPAAARATAAASQQAAAAAQLPLDVRIERLSDEKAAPASSGRNPFEFRARATPPPPTTSGLGGSGGLSAPPLPTGPPPPPPIALKFIGLVEGKSGLRVAVLSDGRSAPMYGKQGDIIDGRYRVVTIGVESIELEHVDGRGRQTIRLTGQ